MAEQEENVAAILEPRKKEWYATQEVSVQGINYILNRLSGAGIPPEHIKVSCFGSSFANTMIWYYSDKKIL